MDGCLVTLGLAVGSLTSASAYAVGGGAVPAAGSYGFVAKVDFGGAVFYLYAGGRRSPRARSSSSP
ncbi:hypothetical protein ACLQ28_14305 [Micromonospora sp. DT201]|uniref:hypothetical protein n=1 Tax=Micromonospora sp. DT201 TaxID=3393442 RepID=UPI003CF78942